MAGCGPSCTIPSCASTPSVGFGPSGFGGQGSRSLALPPFALAGTSASLGNLDGITPSCINQIPSAEVVVQPPAVIVTLPGPILSASCEPVSVGGNTPCAAGGGSQGLPTCLLGGGSLGLSPGRRYKYVGERGSICYSPC